MKKNSYFEQSSKPESDILFRELQQQKTIIKIEKNNCFFLLRSMITQNETNKKGSFDENLVLCLQM